MATRSTTSSPAIRAASPRCSCTAGPAAAATSTRGGSSIRRATASSSSTSAAPGAAGPHASLEANTTWHLVADMERLRRHLGVERWLVFGGSWGSTLALAYAEMHPAGRQRARAARHLLAAASSRSTGSINSARACCSRSSGRSTWRRFRPRSAAICLARIHRRLLSARCRGAARGRARVVDLGRSHELAASRIPKREEQFGTPEFALALARIEAHYFVNRGFFEHESQLLDGVDKHPADTGRDRARPLRRRVSDRDGVGAAPALARGRAQDRARRRSLGVRARHHGRARRGDGSILELEHEHGMSTLQLVNAQVVNEGRIFAADC